MPDHLETCSIEHGLDECDCPAANGPGWLDCDHCGHAAIHSPNSIFTDGDAGECASCELPGYVEADGDYARWVCSDDVTDRCSLDDCEECRAADEESDNL